MTETSTGEDLGNIAPRTRGLEVHTVLSTDGTPIAYEKSGSGPALVIVGGGLNDKATFATLADLLSPNFTVFNYDRRARGDTGWGDPDQHTVDKELDDLEAIIGLADGPCQVFGNCSGGNVALLAAARGVRMAKLVTYEPPYAVDGTRPPIPADYRARLTKLVEQDRKADAIALFQREGILCPEEFIQWFRNHPAWPYIEPLAPSLVYDTLVVGDLEVPYHLLDRVTVETVVLDGSESPQWMLTAMDAISERIPRCEHFRLEGKNHLFDQVDGAPLLLELFSS